MDNSPSPNEQALIPADTSDAAPALSNILYTLAVVSALLSMFICANVWPTSSYREPEFVAYIPAITWLVASIIQGTLFASLGLGLHYLKQIAEKKPA